MKIKRLISHILLSAIMLIPFSAFAENEEINLLTNGDFEQESDLTALDWNFKTYNIWYSDGAIKEENGNHYASVTGSGIGQNIAIEADTSYTLTANVKSTGTTTLNIQNGDAQYPGTMPASTLASATVTGSEWHTVTLNYDADGLVGHLFIYLWSDTGVTTDIDDVKLVKNGAVLPKPIIADSFTAENIWARNAGNPLMPGYIGDPYMFRDDDGTYYVYGTTDGYGPETTGGIFHHAPYAVWYSKDLVNWKSKTFSYEDGTFPKTSETLWAPSVTKAANGKYYMAYIWQGYNCYLAESESPLGPWKDTEAFGSDPVSSDMFDSDIVTIDGTTYIVFNGIADGSHRRLMLGEFNEDMTSFSTPREIIRDIFEGGGIFKYGNKYYLTWSDGNLGGSYHVNYAMADDIYGAYEKKGTIIARDDAKGICCTGHSNIIEVDGDAYICYHRKFDGAAGARQAAMEKLTFNDDKTIAYVAPTVNGTRPDLPLTVTDKNLAWDVNVKATASSIGSTAAHVVSKKWLPQYAIDRNNGTLWQAETTGAEWFMLDLGETQTIDRVETFFEYHTLPYKYKMEYSAEGENWETLSDKLNNTSCDSPQIDKSEENITARYIRITFAEGGVDIERGTNEGGTPYNSPVGIFEINVYGESSQTLRDTVEITSENGKISYTSEYDSEKYRLDMFAAVYDENGALLEVKKNETSAEFDTLDRGKYTVKVFFWDNMKPVYDAITRDFQVQ